MKNYINKISLIVLIFFSSLTYSQISQQEIDTANQIVFDGLTKENFVKSIRQTKEGELAACDLEYQYTYRDYKAKKGTPIIVQGALSFIYSKGKNPGLVFKISPVEINVGTQKWTSIDVPYVDIFVSKVSFQKYIVADFICENGGKCLAYEDKDFSMSKILFDQKLFDAEIKFSLTKGGVDNTFLTSSLLAKEKYSTQINDFMNCNLERINKITLDIKEMSKKNNN